MHTLVQVIGAGQRRPSRRLYSRREIVCALGLNVHRILREERADPNEFYYVGNRSASENIAARISITRTASHLLCCVVKKKTRINKKRLPALTARTELI